ncbi:MAG: AsmA family protein, partial [Pseudomonadota bacterium]
MALAALFIVPSFWNWSQYKQQFEARASDVVGLPVRVTGETSVRLLPTPKVRFTDIVIGNAADALAGTVSRFEMNVELTPLATGEVRIFDMKIVEPNLNLSLAEDMRFDFGDPLEADEAPGGTRIVFENVAVSDGSLQVVDESTDRSIKFSDFSAVVNARDVKGPWRAIGTTHAEIGLRQQNAPNLAERVEFDFGTGTVQDDGGFRTRLTVVPKGRPVELEMQGDVLIEDGVPSLDGRFKIAQRPLDDTPTPEAAGFFDWWEADGQLAVSMDALSSSDFELRLADREDPYKISGLAELDFAREGGFDVQATGEQVDLKRFAALLPGAKAVTLPSACLHSEASCARCPPYQGRAG